MIPHPATLNISDDTIALPCSKLPTLPPLFRPFFFFFFQISTNMELLAQTSSHAYSALKSLTSTRLNRTSLSFANDSHLLSLPIAPPFPQEPLPTNQRLHLHEWPPSRPRPSPSVFPSCCSANPFLACSLCELRGAVDWSPDYIEPDGGCFARHLGVGDERVGRWTHKGCFLASVTIIFPLDLTCLFGFLLTWFAGKSTVQTACLCVTAYLAASVHFTMHSHLQKGELFSQYKLVIPTASLYKMPIWSWRSDVYQESLN